MTSVTGLQQTSHSFQAILAGDIEDHSNNSGGLLDAVIPTYLEVLIVKYNHTKPMSSLENLLVCVYGLKR